MKKRLSLFLLIFVFALIGCTEQKKAERAVNKFIKKFATYPESYEPIETLDLEEYEGLLKGYKLGVMYRIKNKDGVVEVRTHEFKLTKEFNVYMDAFEQFE